MYIRCISTCTPPLFWLMSIHVKLFLSNQASQPMDERLRFTSKWSCHRAFSWSLWVSMEGLHRLAQDHSSTWVAIPVFLLVERQDPPLPKNVINVCRSLNLVPCSRWNEMCWDSFVSCSFYRDYGKQKGRESQDAICNLEGWYGKVGRWRYERQMVQQVWKVSCYEFERSTLKLTAF